MPSTTPTGCITFIIRVFFWDGVSKKFDPYQKEKGLPRAASSSPRNNGPAPDILAICLCNGCSFGRNAEKRSQGGQGLPRCQLARAKNLVCCVFFFFLLLNYCRCIERLGFLSWNRAPIDASFFDRLNEIARGVLSFVQTSDSIDEKAHDPLSHFIFAFQTLLDAGTDQTRVLRALHLVCAVLDNAGTLEAVAVAFFLWFAGLLQLIHDMKMFGLLVVPDSILHDWKQQDGLYKDNTDIFAFRSMLQFLQGPRFQRVEQVNLPSLLQVYGTAKLPPILLQDILPSLEVHDIVGGGSRRYREACDDDEVLDNVDVQGMWTEWKPLISVIASKDWFQQANEFDTNLVPTQPGVYELAVSGHVAYVGQSNNLCSRLRQYQASGSHLQFRLRQYLLTGHAVSCRWLLTTEKQHIETTLLEFFDYAFNMKQNEGPRALLQEFPEGSDQWRSILDITKMHAIMDRIKANSRLLHLLQQCRDVSAEERGDLLFVLSGWCLQEEKQHHVVPTDIQTEGRNRAAFK